MPNLKIKYQNPKIPNKNNLIDKIKDLTVLYLKYLLHICLPSWISLKVSPSICHLRSQNKIFLSYSNWWPDLIMAPRGFWYCSSILPVISSLLKTPTQTGHKGVRY